MHGVALADWAVKVGVFTEVNTEHLTDQTLTLLQTDNKHVRSCLGGRSYMKSNRRDLSCSYSHLWPNVLSKAHFVYC